MSSGAGAAEVVVRFRDGRGSSEELRNLSAWLETETPGGQHARLREAPAAEAKTGVFQEIVYVLAGGFAGGVAEELTKPLVEAVKSWVRLRRERGQSTAELVVERRGEPDAEGRQVVAVVGGENTEAAHDEEA